LARKGEEGMVKRGTWEEGRSEELGEKRKRQKRRKRREEKRRKEREHISSAPLYKILNPPLPVSQTK
jgi:hypothetical protein